MTLRQQQWHIYIYILKSYKTTTTTWATTNKQRAMQVFVPVASTTSNFSNAASNVMMPLTFNNKFSGVVLEIGGNRVSQTSPRMS
jgi:hypothetical protein